VQSYENTQDEVVAAAAFLRQRYPSLGLEKSDGIDFQDLSGILISCTDMF